MDVIGAGYSRTGTLSVVIALEKLLGKPQAGDQELAFKLLREVTNGYSGCTDMPHVMMIPELVELYPDAKVVLVTRNPGRWSVTDLIFSALPNVMPELLEVYNCEVIKLVPKERLVVIDIKDGWDPLCKFLGKTVPNEPFPRVNEAEAIAKTGRGLIVKFVLIWLNIIAVPGILLSSAPNVWSVKPCF
ncbi:hypothetical protein BKA67DRAFT_635786 [Truncatella angustata]|uniref:Sulfotransferase n=1 Tax=Truncatella angustata TaxID=152316 RepID=A0A9P8UUF3_9PEZI|nr:uncharacterized protein BKA67DRAFT_635786 [Truncatella angustata]KAH6658707.1 hypothetical protein BKA67DRAFT_635786 [Truncatella angustata]